MDKTELENLVGMAALLEHAEEMQRGFSFFVQEMRYLYEAKCAWLGITPIPDGRQQVMH